MRASEFFLKTYKEIPKEAQLPSFKLLLRGGFIFQTASGLFSLLPLGFRVFQKLTEIIREELNRVGCQEILMPIVHPARLWKESGRYFEAKELLKAMGRDEDYVLAMTHEESVTDIVRKLVFSASDLPFIFNQIQTKFRDEPRPRGGLLRLKEFIMQDAYSFDKDEKGLDESYNKIISAYEKIFQRLKLPVLKVSASSGIMGGSLSEEFMVLSENGEDKVVLCSKCDYKSNIECASSIVNVLKTNVKFRKKEEVETPAMTTVSEVATYLKVPESAIIKSMIYKGKSGNLALVLIRGDREINEAKLEAVIGETITPASKGECEERGLIVGFAGPIGIKDIPVYADYSLKQGGPYVIGANKPDTHLVGIEVKDLKINKWADITQVKEGDICSKCGGRLVVKKAIELGHTFKLGTKYSKSMRAYFTDKDGKKKPIIMGCYGIGLERLMAACAEIHHDEKGIIWPKEIAPFSVYLMEITRTKKEVKMTEDLYNKLMLNNIDVLYDDRDKTVGFKFADADLIGCPLRIVVSRRALEKNSVEIKPRDKKETIFVNLEKLIGKVKELLS